MQQAANQVRANNTAEAQPAGADLRQHPRVAVDRHITCSLGGTRISAFVYDLSVGGCMFEVDGPLVGPIDEIAVCLVGTDHPAKLVWAIGDCVGVRFRTDLHAAIVEHYGFVPAAVDFDQVVPRDKFGRPLPPLGRFLG